MMYSLVSRHSARRCIFQQCRALSTAAAVVTRPIPQQPLHNHSSNTVSFLLLWTGILGSSLACFRENNDNNKTLLEQPPSSDEEATTLLNWSGTHAVTTRHYWEPETIQQVQAIVSDSHRRGQGIRPVGSALSPNGIAFSETGMMSLVHLDKIVQVTNDTVTVQAGARISQVIDALRPHHKTLPNLASIAEQQMGGFVQVGAHGTGRTLAPVDEYVTKLKLVTPSQGTITLSRDSSDPYEQFLFRLACVGLGCIGIVVEVTMQIVRAHNLVEHTYVLTRQEAIKQADDLLHQHKHVRYMWIPYTDAVVVVTNDPEEGWRPRRSPPMSEEAKMKPLTDLLLELKKDDESITKETISTMGFGEVRDALLAIDPLNVDHVKRCNAAEADFWRNSTGYKIRPSDELLQFDCGGQQWVLEQCFPTGTQEKSNGNDMEFMKQLLAGIEEQEIPAHSPIEQRWTASSSSAMSPAHGPPDGLHSWVGIINYLPPENETQRRRITEAFTGPYCDWLRKVGHSMNAASHWAKLERPTTVWAMVDAQMFLQERYPLEQFNAIRKDFDPKNILGNSLLNTLLGDHRLMRLNSRYSRGKINRAVCS